MIKSYPKISIITPSLNQGQFIEKTILSVINQKYPNLEFIVMDGGSTDETLHILKKYKKYIKVFSEKDTGQSDAINKGLKKATGEIVGYLNSDDLLLSGSLFKVSNYFSIHSEINWVTGKCYIIDDKGKEMHKLITSYKNIFLKRFRKVTFLKILNFISQPATFWKKQVFQKVGFFDTRLNYVMDYDYWLRLYKYFQLGYIDSYLAAFRIHGLSKSGKNYQNIFAENSGIALRYSNNKLIFLLHQIHDKITVYIYNLIRDNI